eukprot:TRINITY_DN4623_c0_g1_i2.p1 TRINITY_DN4623_c0_g1~~TRINITY_DN4623_c0_g1_i2.p1  ORF type:complete len:134 (+),score=13.53 TRINITY_DN4623_c0_g1_i2:285-686(+)
MTKIESKLFELHAVIKENKENNPVEEPAEEPVQETPTISEDSNPFARVNTVAPGSPANESGLMPNDLIIKFGTVNHSNHNNLSSIKDVVMNSVGSPIPLTVKRSESILTIYLTPHQWSGQGLLGCHLLPYKQQ